MSFRLIANMILRLDRIRTFLSEKQSNHRQVFKIYCIDLYMYMQLLPLNGLAIAHTAWTTDQSINQSSIQQCSYS